MDKKFLDLKAIMPEKKKNKKKRKVEFYELKPFPNSKREKKRVGRGEGSGLGKTSGRGQKGQKSRTGYSKKLGFEGGQMPLYKRIPKRGFRNPFKKEYQIVNLFVLEKAKLTGDVTIDVLLEKKLIYSRDIPVKVLGLGNITSPIHLYVHAVSKPAREKIESAGGKIEIIK